MKKMKKIIFVMGPSGIGKSTFIKKHLSKYKCLDILTYQIELFEKYGIDRYTTPSVIVVMRSYVNLMNGILRFLKNKTNDILIVEHTLLKSKRRKWFLRKIADTKINVEIIGIYFDIIKTKKHQTEMITISKKIQDLPKLSEGFDEVFVCKKWDYEKKH